MADFGDQIGGLVIRFLLPFLLILIPIVLIASLVLGVLTIAIATWFVWLPLLLAIILIIYVNRNMKDMKKSHRIVLSIGLIGLAIGLTTFIGSTYYREYSAVILESVISSGLVDDRETALEKRMREEREAHNLSNEANALLQGYWTSGSSDVSDTVYLSFIDGVFTYNGLPWHSGFNSYSLTSTYRLEDVQEVGLVYSGLIHVDQVDVNHPDTNTFPFTISKNTVTEEVRFLFSHVKIEMARIEQ